MIYNYFIVMVLLSTIHYDWWYSGNVTIKYNKENTSLNGSVDLYHNNFKISVTGDGPELLENNTVRLLHSLVMV